MLSKRYIGIWWQRCKLLEIGYLIDVDYEDGSFGYDTRQGGPALGLTFEF
jgi:hypothetical protein